MTPSTAYSPDWRDLALAFCAARDATDHPAGPGAAGSSPVGASPAAGPTVPHPGPAATKATACTRAAVSTT